MSIAHIAGVAMAPFFQTRPATTLSGDGRQSDSSRGGQCGH